MTQLVNYKETYNTIPELLDRVGYLRGMIDYSLFSERETKAREAFQLELIDREIELIEMVAQIEDDGKYFSTVSFGMITPEIARTLYLQIFGE